MNIWQQLFIEQIELGVCGMKYLDHRLSNYI